MSVLLVLLLAIPLAGAIVCALLPGARAAKTWALLVSLATLAVALPLFSAIDFQPAAPEVTDGNAIEPLRDTFTVVWPEREPPPVPGELPKRTYNPLSLEGLGFAFRLGLDAISFWLVLLTVGLMPLALISSFDSIKERQKEYYAWMLLLMVAMIGVFIARDLLLFYIFFELTLVPMFFIIGIWGGPERRYAAGKFFLFTFAGSIFTLAAVVYLGLSAGRGSSPSFDMLDVVAYARTLGPEAKWWVFLGLLAGFAVKVPLFPVHTWLPLAHTEAPTAGSVILAGVLLKLGTYGLLRLVVPLGMPEAAYEFIGILCLIGVIYAALIAWVQTDIKKLVAYSSVSHLGFCVLGLVALNTIGIQGSVLYMINHGLSTGALFLVIGMIYDRYHTRDINELSGLARKMPKLAFFFVLFAMSSIGLPGLNGFVSEFLTILGAFTSDVLGIGYGAIAAIGIILGAIYMLHMLARVVWGPLKVPEHHDTAHTAHGEAPVGSQADRGQAATPEHHTPGDIGLRETGILIPLAMAVIFLGLWPTPILRSMLPGVKLIQPQVVVTDGGQPVAVTALPLPPGEGGGEGVSTVR